MNASKLLLFAFILFNQSLNAQTGHTGIGTVEPTNKLHIVAAADPLRLEGVQSSSDNSDRALVIDKKGVIKRSLTEGSAFGGTLAKDLIVEASTTNITKIIVQTEYLDRSNEYDPATGEFIPLSSGVYLFEMELTFSAPNSPTSYGETGSDRAVMGLVDKATGQWIGRYNFQPSLDPRANFVRGIAKLTAGKAYHFGVTAAGVNTSGGIVHATTTGGTGVGVSTYFFLQRLQ